MLTIPDQIQQVRKDVNGYKFAQLLMTAERLRLFAALEDGPKTVEEVAANVCVEKEKLASFLNALVACSTLEVETGHYRVALDREVLRPSSGAAQNGYIRYAAEVRDRWLELDTVLTGDALTMGNFGDITGADPEAAASFIAAMDANARPQARSLCEKMTFSRARILDVGAGAGTYAIEVGKKYVDSSGVVFDLPGVAPLTERYLASAGLGNRFAVCAGDYHTALPDGEFSDVFLFAVIHQEREDAVLSLLKEARARLLPGGRLFVSSFFLNDDRTSPLFSAMFAVEMLVMVPNGRVYTHTEMHDLFARAGFLAVARIDEIPGPASFYMATVE